MKAGDCIHFSGIQNICAAGIDPRTVRDEARPGPYRWPCITIHPSRRAATTCASFRAMTEEEQRENDRELSRIVDAFVAGRCPTHGVDLVTAEGSAVVVSTCPAAGCDFVGRSCGDAGGET